MIDSRVIFESLQELRAKRPLVHNITNFVVMNSSANLLLALGASPVMAHAEEEIDEICGISQALVVNIGTLSPPWVAAMKRAIEAAKRQGVPVVLDPVGAGATSYRTETALDLLSQGAAVLRGNASEILALKGDAARTKGVDSTDEVSSALGAARAIASDNRCVVCASGASDIMTDGELTYLLTSGDHLMERITGLGCAASAFIAAFLAVQSNPLIATVSAMAVLGSAGGIAAKHAAGPGSFEMILRDRLYSLSENELLEQIKIEEI